MNNIFAQKALAYEEYKRMKAKIELLEILVESDEDMKLGRTGPIKDSFDGLRRILREEM